MLRVYVVDDEAPARKRLLKLLAEFEKAGRVTVLGEATDGVEAIAKLKETEVDLVFLDIQMPGFDGFEVIERLDPVKRPVIVFTTAYDEYALRAFEANAVDYMLKPIPRERLAKALEKAESIVSRPDSRADMDSRVARLLDWMDAEAIGSTPGAATPSGKKYLEQMSIPYRDRILIVPVERLVSIEIAEGITRVHILEEDQESTRHRIKQHIVSYTLDQLGELLDPDRFMRVHRSAIVQVAHIRELIPWFSGRYKLLLTSGHEVIASRERSKVLKERLMA